MSLLVWPVSVALGKYDVIGLMAELPVVHVADPEFKPRFEAGPVLLRVVNPGGGKVDADDRSKHPLAQKAALECAIATAQAQDMAFRKVRVFLKQMLKNAGLAVAKHRLVNQRQNRRVIAPVRELLPGLVAQGLPLVPMPGTVVQRC